MATTTDGCDNTIGRCSAAWTGLCGYVGQLCINIETVIGGLIKNQHLLRHKIEYYNADAVNFPDCTMLYLDTDSCTYSTDCGGGTNIPFGSHIGGGWIQPSGSVICASVGLTSTGGLAPACTPVDCNLDPLNVGDAGIFGWTLETAVSGGCTEVFVSSGITCDCCHTHETVNDSVGNGFLNNYPWPVDNVQQDHRPDLTLTIPQDGIYNVSYFLSGTTNAGSPLNQVEIRTTLRRIGMGAVILPDVNVITTAAEWNLGRSQTRFFAAGTVLMLSSRFRDLAGTTNQTINVFQHNIRYELVAQDLVDC